MQRNKPAACVLILPLRIVLAIVHAETLSCDEYEVALAANGHAATTKSRSERKKNSRAGKPPQQAFLRRSVY